MNTSVQKYGGSSVSSLERIQRVADRIASTRRAGSQVVVVVSAMGKTTENLLEMAAGIAHDPSHRELDMLLSAGERISTALLAMAVEERGLPAISLTGGQGGIVTDEKHFRATILDVRPERIRSELEQGKVVILAGYQGLAETRETTTLGRGGSDITAVAIAAALEANVCELNSDVEGIFTADPRIVDRATALAEISYDEMYELARHGAGVLNADAVDYARRDQVTLRARSTFHDSEGTLVRANTEEGPAIVRGVACHPELFRVSIPESGALTREVLEAAGDPEVFLDTQWQPDRRELFLASDSLAARDSLAERLTSSFRGRVDIETGLGSVSAIGRGVGENERHREAVDDITRQLGAKAETIHSEDFLTCLLPVDVVAAATRSLHGQLVEPQFGGAS